MVNILWKRLQWKVLLFAETWITLVIIIIIIIFHKVTIINIGLEVNIELQLLIT